MATLENAVDTYTNAARANKNYGQVELFRTRTGGAGNQYGWMFFGIPGLPRGATIQSATLYLHNKTAQTGANQVTIRLADNKWRVNEIAHSGTGKAAMPGVTGPSGTLSKTAAAADTEWAIPVTALMQQVATTGIWWGFRIATDTTASNAWHSAQSPDIDLRPVLVVLWKAAPEAPTQCSPAGGRAIAKQFPEFSFDFNDPGGDQPMASFQVQIAATEAELGTATDYDTGEIPSAIPTFYTDSTHANYIAPPGGAWAGITAGQTRWWRVRVKDTNGQWSPYSAAMQFKRVDKVLPVITNPAASPNNFIWEATPPFTYTYAGTGATAQVSHEILVRNNDKKTEVFWSSGKITTASLAETPTLDAVADITLTYELVVRVWDATDREKNGDDPICSEAVRTFTYNHDNTVTGVSGLTVTQVGELPRVQIDFTRATAPDAYIIRLNGVNVREFVPADILVSGTAYRTFLTIPARSDQLIEVLAVVNAKQSLPASSTKNLPLIAPILMRKNGADAVMFLNPKRSKQANNVQELHRAMDGKPMLVTQTISGSSGAVSGLLTAEGLSGVTAKQQKARLESMRDDGVGVQLVIADEMFEVVIFNVEIDSVTRPSSIDYFAEFEWAAE